MLPRPTFLEPALADPVGSLSISLGSRHAIRAEPQSPAYHHPPSSIDSSKFPGWISSGRSHRLWEERTEPATASAGCAQDFGVVQVIGVLVFISREINYFLPESSSVSALMERERPVDETGTID